MPNVNSSVNALNAIKWIEANGDIVNTLKPFVTPPEGYKKVKSISYNSITGKMHIIVASS